MSHEIADVPLGPSAMGTQRSVRMFRFGAAQARPKAYVQAGLHADETPGLLVAHHLVRLLQAAAARGDIDGQVVVAPRANPIGLSQFIHGDQSGRFELASGTNFNRGWPDITERVGERIDGRLGQDARENVHLIRAAMGAAHAAAAAEREIDALHRVLAREACDADLVLDLHCDDEALMHLFLESSQWPRAQDLAGELGCQAVLLADDAGAATFADRLFTPWSRLAAAFPDYPIPHACLPVTVELRGFADVSDALAERDAAALYRALQRRGHVRGDPGPAPGASCQPTGLDACDIIRAPCAGVVSYHAELGQRLSSGDRVAEIIDPAAATPDDARRTVRTAAAGIVLTRRLRKFVCAGEVVAKVAGSAPLAHRQGYLLED